MTHYRHSDLCKLASRMACATPLLIPFLVLATGCGGGTDDAQPQKKAPLVTVETVTAGEIVRSLELTGEVVPIEAIQISSTVEGPIGFLPWREGDRVEAGQKLVEIDREMYRAELKAAEAALAVAQAKLNDLNAGTRPEEIDKARQSVREAEQSAEFEKSDLDRIVQLVETGALPGEDVEKARVKQTAAEAKLQAARRHLDMLEAGFTRTAIAVQEAAVKETAAKLELAQARLNETIIVAPFAGTITKVYIRPGDMALARTPLLEMTDMGSLVLRFAVPESNAMAVRVGQTVTFELDALKGETFSTRVVRVYPELDPQMRTRLVDASLIDIEGIAPHMFVRVTLEIERAEGTLVVPVEAVLVSPEGHRIGFVVEDGIAFRRELLLGIEHGSQVQVVSGLKVGEKIAVAGNEQLRPGMPVRVAGEQAGGQPEGQGGKRGQSGRGGRGGQGGQGGQGVRKPGAQKGGPS